jgi:predicted permease
MQTAEVGPAVSPAVARLSPGASLAIAQQQFDGLSARLVPELGRAAHRVLVEPLRPAMFWYGYRYLWLLTAAASVVGLLACLNLSNLLLARGRSRAHEAAVRASLGASRSRLLVMELVRSLGICVLACAISLVILYWLTQGLQAIMPGYFRLLMVRQIDARVVGFTIVAMVTAGIVSGGAPAWRATRTNLMAVMQREQGLPAHERRNRIGKTAIAFEAALGVVLVLAAAMVVRNFITLLKTDPGFAPTHLYVLRVQPTGERRGGDDAAELARYRGILDSVRQLPDVENAGAVDSMPASGNSPMTGIETLSGGRFGLWQITDGFLEAIGARLVAGRTVSAADMTSGTPVAVVSVSAARRLWPDVPMHAIVGRDIAARQQPTRRVVGVVADLREKSDQPAQPMVFAAVRPEGLWFLDIAMRTRPSAPPPNGEAIRRMLAVPFGVTAANVSPAGATIASSLQQPRTQALMFGTFAVIALLLAGLGLYAVTSFDVALRRYELGIRLSLGAPPAALRRLVMMDAVRPVLAGTAMGLMASYWISRWIQTLVYDVHARDPWTFTVVAVTLIGTAAAGSWLPARRASRIDPADVFRDQ